MNHIFYRIFSLTLLLFFSIAIKSHDETLLYVLKKAQESNDSHLIALKKEAIDKTILNHFSIKINENSGYREALLIIKKHRKNHFIRQNDTSQYNNALRLLISNLDQILADIKTAVCIDLDQNHFTDTDSGFLDLIFCQTSNHHK